ncbi:LCCL domain-containing protein, partial [Oleiphilus sp. HI0117]
SLLFIFSLTPLSHADAFAEMEADSSREASTYAELDAETGSCLTELRENNQRATKMLAVLKKKKSKIAKLEGKVESLTAKLIDRSGPKACDTSALNQRISILQNQNAQLNAELTTLRSTQAGNANQTQQALLTAQRENLALKQQMAELQNKLMLAGSKSNTVVQTVTANSLPNVSGIDIEETVDASWKSSARGFQNRLGQDFAYNCPPNGAVQNVYGGNNKYYVDSSVCTAAIHAGLMTAKSGGTVAIRIIRSKHGFKGSYKNDIQSNNRNNRYQKGFTFIALP